MVSGECEWREGERELGEANASGERQTSGERIVILQIIIHISFLN